MNDAVLERAPVAAAPAVASASSTASLWRYGLLGAPLAFVSLPLYVLLPHHAAERYGAPLAALGALLLATRAADALVDPWIGRLVDRLFGRGPLRAWGVACMAAVALAAGFAALWMPPQAAREGARVLAWLGAALVVTYAGYSLLSVIHQAWGARWGGSQAERARIVAWREAAALLGVLVASALPSWAGFAATSGVLALALVAGLWALRATAGAASSPGPPPAAAGEGDAVSPWADASFRALVAVFVLNGMASAIPATLLPFFVADVLRVPQAEPLFLGTYFAAAALGLPLWVRGVRAVGLAGGWRLGMGLAIAAFAAAPFLGPGDTVAFVVVCAASGAALGADLALPAALLAGVVREAGAQGRGEGRYFGWWACAAKLNLALAAGLSLPLLAWAGYEVGSRDAAATTALALAYGALPLGLKALALVLLWRAERRHPALATRSAT